MTRLLYPPLARIERELFGGDAGAGNAGPDAVDPARPLPDAAVTMPPHLLAMVERRVAAARAHPPGPAAVGQIRRIVAVRAPDGELRQLGRACAVLLGHGAGGRRWAGWLVAQESDWASERDLVLQEDDGILAPEAAMVQAWNPVEVELGGDEALLGKLDARQLEIVQKLADYSPREFTPARPGRIGAWELEPGTTVVTGTPLAGDDDPRAAYQALYRRLAVQLAATSQPGRSASRQRAPASAASWIDWLRATFVKPAWTAGLAGLAVVQAALLVSGGAPRHDPEAIYRSAPPVPADDACRTRIRLMFKVDTPYADVVVTLRRVDARLAGGPSETGELWILPPAGQDADEVAAMLRQSQAVEQSDVVLPDERQCRR